jgi:hypothetical protein
MKERNKIRLGALIAAILLGALCCAFGQVEILDRYNDPNIVTFIPERPIEFGKEGAKKGDKTNGYMSMYVDQFGYDTAYVRFFVNYPKSKDVSKYDVIIKFVDGSFKKLEMTAINIKENYAEYLVDAEAYDNFYWMGVEVVLFKSKNADENFTSDLGYTPKYFYHFLHTCKQ